ncbi:MAG: JAB domain-containing protein [Gammaproteobacteria bacterium]
MVMKASKHRDRPNRVKRLSRLKLRDEEQLSLLRLALDTMAARFQPGATMSNPQLARDYLRLKLGERHNEIFGCVFLDNRHRIIAFDELFRGTIDGTTVYPRVVVQRALEVNAAAVLLFHNHPSGVAEPSAADESITRRLKDALSLVDIRVIDHIVVALEGTTSLAERGYL